LRRFAAKNFQPVEKTVQGKEIPPTLPDAGREEGGHAS